MKINKKFIALVFAISLLNSPITASASGIPTVDASAIAQAVMSLEQLKNTYAQIVQQYNQAVSTYQNFTGNRGLGMLFYKPELRQFLPENFSSQLKNVLSNGVTSLSARGKEIYEEQNLKELCNRYAGQLLYDCQKQQAANAEYQAALTEAQQKAKQKYDTIVQLQNAINNTQDAKAIQELSARIQSEQSTLESSRAQAAYELELAKARMETQKAAEAQKQHEHAFKALTPEQVAEIMRY